ncbi:hypothetical protein [Haliovirga abyssi]|uniref:Uncharacterized protein n=1 Tax=Haliovirga abyssi TaxID=2996794 RepID=A0AAU9DBH2_9FUSO|nr:hypothetical protein [Haliovirga abyssi]BDU50605.1 hypothetical protein HLVA_11740 [Haliovirga abyssi]
MRELILNKVYNIMKKTGKNFLKLILKIDEKITFEKYKREREKRKKIGSKYKNVEKKVVLEKIKVQELQKIVENQRAQIKNCKSNNEKLKYKLKIVENELKEEKEKNESIIEGMGNNGEN